MLENLFKLMKKRFQKLEFSKALSQGERFVTVQKNMSSTLAPSLRHKANADLGSARLLVASSSSHCERPPVPDQIMYFKGQSLVQAY